MRLCTLGGTGRRMASFSSAWTRLADPFPTNTLIEKISTNPYNGDYYFGGSGQATTAGRLARINSTTGDVSAVPYNNYFKNGIYAVESFYSISTPAYDASFTATYPGTGTTLTIYPTIANASTGTVTGTLALGATLTCPGNTNPVTIDVVTGGAPTATMLASFPSSTTTLRVTQITGTLVTGSVLSGGTVYGSPTILMQTVGTGGGIGDYVITGGTQSLGTTATSAYGPLTSTTTGTCTLSGELNITTFTSSSVKFINGSTTVSLNSGTAANLLVGDEIISINGSYLTFHDRYTVTAIAANNLSFTLNKAYTGTTNTSTACVAGRPMSAHKDSVAGNKLIIAVPYKDNSTYTGFLYTRDNIGATGPSWSPHSTIGYDPTKMFFLDSRTASDMVYDGVAALFGSFWQGGQYAASVSTGNAFGGATGIEGFSDFNTTSPRLYAGVYNEQSSSKMLWFAGGKAAVGTVGASGYVAPAPQLVGKQRYPASGIYDLTTAARAAVSSQITAIGKVYVPSLTYNWIFFGTALGELGCNSTNINPDYNATWIAIQSPFTSADTVTCFGTSVTASARYIYVGTSTGKIARADVSRFAFGDNSSPLFVLMDSIPSGSGAIQFINGQAMPGKLLIGGRNNYLATYPLT